ncbi:MAG: Asp23/Gls24 family envelope stress response protein [Anaerolineae bacterium]|nr:Asp23/Gls24 family envelope stress response protein [Anaerolineae bacterium]MDW8101056.1 Asp23/Gls24 family envelope stress response protein [Anaerolineae bacterium]
MEEKLGKVIIAPEVLTTIVRLTALSQPGVRRMAPAFPPLGRLWGRADTAEGVHLDIADDSVAVDLYIIADASVNMRELGETLQREIARAIQDMVGMMVRQVNVHIDGVEFASTSELASSSRDLSRPSRPSGR